MATPRPLPSLYDHGADLLRALYARRIDTPPVLDAATHFAHAQTFTAHWPALRAEALAIAADLGRVPRFHELMPAQADISAHDGRDWRMFVVKAYGVAIAANAARCPTLSALLAGTPEVLSAAFSYLAPGKHVPAHRGPFRGVLRYTLHLDVPRDAHGRSASPLTIDGTTYRLDAGEGLLWDDTFVHEVRNDGDRVRVALLLDVQRRSMPRDLQWLSRLIVAAVGAGVRWRRHPG